MILINYIPLSSLLFVIFLSLSATAKSSADTNCSVNFEGDSFSSHRWIMPLTHLGGKYYYFGTFFKANWYRAAQYCRYHGLDLTTIPTLEENSNIVNYIKDSGYITSSFWTSGTDLGTEGSFFWLSSGRPITFADWWTGQPDNHKFPEGETENCIGYLPVAQGLKWNDWKCSVEMFFICELL